MRVLAQILGLILISNLTLSLSAGQAAAEYKSVQLKMRADKLLVRVYVRGASKQWVQVRYPGRCLGQDTQSFNYFDSHNGVNTKQTGSDNHIPECLQYYGDNEKIEVRLAHCGNQQGYTGTACSAHVVSVKDFSEDCNSKASIHPKSGRFNFFPPNKLRYWKGKAVYGHEHDGGMTNEAQASVIIYIGALFNCS